MVRTNQPRLELLGGIWQQLFVPHEGSIPTRYLENFIPQSAMPQREIVDIGTLLVSLRDSGELKRSLQMTAQQLSSTWHNIHPDVKYAILQLGRKYNENAIISLPWTSSDDTALSVSWSASDIMYTSHRDRVLSEALGWGLDLTHGLFVAGSLRLGDIFRRCPETLASLVRARIQWDLAAAVVAGADSSAIVRRIIKERAGTEETWAIVKLRTVLDSLGADGVPSIVNNESVLEPVRAAISATIRDIDVMQPTPDQLSSFRIAVEKIPSRPPWVTPEAENWLIRMLRNEQKKHGVLWVLVGTVLSLVIGALALWLKP